MRAALLACLLLLPTPALRAGEKAPDPLPETSLSKAAPRAVLAHVMVAFRTEEHSGRWAGWDYSNKHVKHDPEKKDVDGRPTIASVHHPAVGPYDMTDPDLVEYHCQLARMAGIDGFTFDLHFFEREGDPSYWSAESMRLYAETMKRYDLAAAVIFEDKAHWLWNREAKTREETVKATCRNMDEWLKLFKDVQYRIGERPLVGLFSYEQKMEGKGTSRLSPEEIAAWLERFPEKKRPVVVTSWFKPAYAGAVSGRFDWPRIEGKPPAGSKFRAWADLAAVRRLQERREAEVRKLLKGGQADFHLAGVWPGFDDRGCWGWGGGPRCIPRLDGEVYRYQWRRALAGGAPVVQIATWNDWFEGSGIEPALEFGTKYLKITREYAARHKGREIPEGNLGLPGRIYALRKGTLDEKALAEAKRASELICAGQFTEAELRLRTSSVIEKLPRTR